MIINTELARFGTRGAVDGKTTTQSFKGVPDNTVAPLLSRVNTIHLCISPLLTFLSSLLNGLVISLPPVLNYGSPELQAKVVPEVLSGKKFIALAISEAFAGSDVSGIQTTAVRDGDYWVVTGTKKYVFIVYRIMHIVIEGLLFP